MRLRNLSTGQDLPDEVHWVRFSNLSWTKDAKRLYYSRYPEPARGKALSAELVGHALYYHAVGTPQTQDRLVFEYPEHPRWFVTGGLTEDGRYLLVSTSKGPTTPTVCMWRTFATRKPDLGAKVKPLTTEDGVEFLVLGNDGPRLFLRSDLDAPNRKVIALDLRRPDRSSWKTIVPESKHTIENVSLLGGRLVVEYWKTSKPARHVRSHRQATGGRDPAGNGLALGIHRPGRLAAHFLCLHLAALSDDGVCA